MLRRAASIAILIAAVWVTFAPVVGFAFLNWDDNLVIVENAALAAPGVARWAFTTTHMEHYQPLSWLAWALLRGTGDPDASAYHAANLVLHGAVTLLVWLLAHTLFAAGQWGQSPDPDRSRGLSPVLAATLAALLFALHPLRVEVVAWISAMPYALATLLALLSTWIWLRAAAQRANVSWLALALFAVSLLARPLALGLPLVFAALDRWRFGRPPRLALLRALPFAALAVAATAAEFVARAPATASEVPWSFRLQSALTAPFVYVWRTLAPVSLTPLDVLPLDPVANPAVIALALVALVLLTVVAWRRRRTYPAVLVAWLSYLALLAPAVGLVPSGLQATADRYTFLPGIVLALAGVGAVIGWARARIVAAPALLAVGALIVVASAMSAHNVLGYWRDSVTVWTRVVSVDPRNDFGHYNLAVALAAAGQADAAAAHYRAVLAINPAHGDARQQLDRLDASRLERQANDLAARGQLEDSVARYQSALDHDPHRPHAQAALGMALATLGRSREALPHLREAVRLGESDSAVFNTLAGLLIESGAAGEARAVLEGAITANPNDVTTAHNLARLLVSTPGLPQPERMRAFRLAEAVVQETNGQDARALATLAATLANIGRMEDARRFNARAARVAAEHGDRELAVQITARGQAYR